MTVIAWDGITLAADKRATSEDGAIRTVTKIIEVVWNPEDAPAIHFIVGMAGDFSIAMELLSWFQDGAATEEFPVSADEGDATLIAISENYGVQTWSGGPEPMYFEDAHLAWGSGRDFATAAMSMGMPSVAAVDFACQHNAFCGGGIDTLTLPGVANSETVH